MEKFIKLITLGLMFWAVLLFCIVEIAHCEEKSIYQSIYSGIKNKVVVEFSSDTGTTIVVCNYVSSDPWFYKCLVNDSIVKFDRIWTFHKLIRWTTVGFKNDCKKNWGE